MLKFFGNILCLVGRHAWRGPWVQRGMRSVRTQECARGCGMRLYEIQPDCW